MEKKHLSILIPTWNRSETVHRLLLSIQVYDLPEIEIIVVDNNSSPEHFRSLSQICSQFKNVKLFQNPQNIGMTGNWNACLEKATGEWMTLVCSDDFFLDNGVSAILKLTHELQSPHLIVQDPAIAEGQRIEPAGFAASKNLNLPIASGNVWHRQIYQTLGGFNSQILYSPDAEYWFRVARYFPVVKVQKHFASYVAHADNYSYATWKKSDFLQQCALLMTKNFSYQNADPNPQLLNQMIQEGLRSTIHTILSVCGFAPSTFKLFWRYLQEGFRIEKSISGKLNFLVWLLQKVPYFILKPIQKTLITKARK